MAKDQRFISEAEHSRMVRAEVRPGDVLYTIAGSIGNACAVGGLDRANINQAIVRVRPFSRIIPQYLVDFLNSSLGRLQARRVANGGVQLNINFSEVRSLRILVPPLDKQRQLVDELAAARASHRLALAEAARLLNSIDDYLLAELGITLPPEPENTLASRIFTAQRRELAGRLDPHFNNRANIALQKTLETVHAVRLRSLVRQVTKGETPLWRGDDYQQEGIQFLRAQNVSPDGLIGDALWIDHAVDHRMQRSRLFGGEILYTMAGTIGIACIYPAERGRANINQAIAKIVLNSEDEIFKSYLVEILNSSICRRQAGRALTVSAQPNINFEQIKSLLIPIPKDGIRVGMIVEKCKATRDKAKHLRHQAKTELEAAKRRIEAMLLGGAV